MRFEDSENYIEEPEPEIKIQRYRVTMIFSDVDDGVAIEGEVEFEMEVEIPRYPDDLELAVEKIAFLRIEHHAEFGRGSLPNLEINTMEKIDQYKT